MKSFSPNSEPLESPHGRMGRIGRLWHSSRLLERWGQELMVLGLLALILAAPWLLHPAENAEPSSYDRRLIIYTPHNDKIRHEFGLAFARHWKKQTGETLYIDWRATGTSELTLMMRSEFAASFELLWTRKLKHPWSRDVAASFANDKVQLPKVGSPLNEAQLARKSFLDSNVGIGADLFFGGGAIDFIQVAKAGFLVSTDASGQYGLAPLLATHPEWLGEKGIPESVSGEAFYDKDKRWIGACLSSMGIIYNRDVIRRLGIPHPPAQWSDLADPRLAGQVAMSDPNKSGTVTKSLEQLIQQQMALAIAELKKQPGTQKSDQDLTNEGVRLGWERGLQMIQRISANARYFTDSATKIPLEVANGDAACGMCIDFYGKTFEEMVRGADGATRVGYVMPVGGSSVSVDPIGMFRGAPEPKVATAFMEFVLSDEGQKLWNFRPNVPGGPERMSLRRLPVRPDFYTDANRRLMADSAAQPFEEAKSFLYHPAWTGSLFGVIRFVTKVMCIDPHQEQQEAWHEMIREGMPPRAMALFFDVKLVSYDKALELAADLSRKDKTIEMKKARELTNVFRHQYEQAAQLAKEGK